MKRMITILLAFFALLSLTGCGRGILGGTLLEQFGMVFSSRIEMIEECLSVDLDDLTDDHINTICSVSDTNGNDLTIQYIDLEGAGEFIEKEIGDSGYWHALPFDSVIGELLESSGAEKQFDFESIREGYFVMSGVGSNSDTFDFNWEHFNEWYGFEIGIWDSNDETLYYISITTQPGS